ncbi:hypothetical protein A3F28_03330 [Candidatus Uhrbacteria bacterium RIFCSPHIGHO2_12_FULL_57_11]|uniref:CDP-diacylglycerol--glycerol-3-phosphate 3-phosphatidyltransferase n=2 Tax=Candidatus Uhriibacteriota TaxID=1752732 RepID=A0A1F7UKR1_9BACT|nr:MAG: hypothetical protein A3D72_01525 [Candidatus Uhrbacteria bacterium RIFCSPHIGHO2_02_FULL_57_19]OGL78859.1 MAG: hypothetical protein A3F28_03330 [Candidatus Uhrbacteria bacterium RIFCSPHIGHO2_12_FULL_57_11]
MALVIDRAVRPLVLHLPAWVTPNAISIVRGLAVIPVVLVHREHPFIAGFGILLPAMLLDLVDGPLARARGQASQIGAFLDATADKIFIHGVLWLACYPRIPLPAAVAMSYLDALLTVIRPMKRYLGSTAKANDFGKWKTVFQAVGIGFYLVRLPILETLGLPILIGALVMAALSFGGHARDLFRSNDF